MLVEHRDVWAEACGEPVRMLRYITAIEVIEVMSFIFCCFWETYVSWTHHRRNPSALNPPFRWEALKPPIWGRDEVRWDNGYAVVRRMDRRETDIVISCRLWTDFLFSIANAAPYLSCRFDHALLFEKPGSDSGHATLFVHYNRSPLFQVGACGIRPSLMDQMGLKSENFRGQ